MRWRSKCPATATPPHTASCESWRHPRLWRDRFPTSGVREWHVHDLATYYDILAPSAASLDIWQTEYLHILADPAAIVEWYKGTGLRPYLDALADDRVRADFLAQYLQGIRKVYPVRRDGRVIFPFRRLFLIAYQRPLSVPAIDSSS